MTFKDILISVFVTVNELGVGVIKKFSYVRRISWYYDPEVYL